ncbi:hypothetical protein OSB04_001117 [Centaurea solstitialis]|uniref:Non-haem dioxygenase N-terminal domain-containing protein n=1 Tax=Centaurea solstitialis TaxID=347529 RepID=A0AA38U0Z0_9ASTR|nr:hypothetical protein OSB04_001117 [Centaurea solstitialis]
MRKRSGVASKGIIGDTFLKLSLNQAVFMTITNTTMRTLSCQEESCVKKERPGDFVSVCNEIPVIDLQENPNIDQSDIIQQILKACQQFGLFQVINHGVSEKMMEDMRVLYNEFFNMPIEDKLGVYSETHGALSKCALYTSGLDYSKEDVHFWKDTLKHPCHPLEEHVPSWPKKPARYREEVGRYVVEVQKMAFKILDFIAEGLGLKKGISTG